MPKLTKTLIDKAESPNKGDIWMWDTEVEGFGVRIQASGRKTYLVRYRTKTAERTQRKLTLGRCSDFAPEKAREMARKVFAQVAEGGDPAQELKPAAKTTSLANVENMFKGYVASMRAKGRTSADEVERFLLLSTNCAADALGRETAACDVTPNDVIDYVSSFFKRGKRSSADKARTYIAAAYNWAIKSANDYTVTDRQDWKVKGNPGADVAKDTEANQARTRNLSNPEVRALWEATIEQGNGFSFEVGAALRVLFASGQRIRETLRLEGSEIDLERKLWIMPKHKTKIKKGDHLIPLPDIIMPTLEGLIKEHGMGPLFPGRSEDEGPLLQDRSLNQAIRRWLDSDSVDIPHLTTRDIRRTWKSRAHDAKIDRFTRDLIQQHAKSDTGSKFYDMADYYGQMREAMDKWGAWLDATMAPPADEEELAIAA